MVLVQKDQLDHASAAGATRMIGCYQAHQFLSERRHENHTDSFRKNTTINCTVLLFNFLKLSGHLSFGL
jgi:abortive infection bacteriophage resistance protein